MKRFIYRMPRRVWILLVVLFLFIWVPGFAWFYQQVPTENYPAYDEGLRADAIVVLTGGKGRLEHGLRLLKDEKAGVMFVTGVGKGVQLGELAEVIGLDSTDPLLDGEYARISLGRTATNTVGNAKETVEWMRKRGYRSLLLVTSYYHMPRSMLEFQHILPDSTLIPYPVFHDKADGFNGARLILLEYHKYVVRRLYWELKQRFFAPKGTEGSH